MLHNHYAGGGLRYSYPLVQYKVIDGVPVLVGAGEGAKLLVDLFLRVRELEIDGRVYPLHNKELDCREVEVGYSESLHRYVFKTLWMPLSQKNYEKYLRLPQEERRPELERLLRGQILSAFKGLGVWLKPEQRILAQVQVRQRTTQFKNQRMLAFAGECTTNAVLPDWIGLGRAVSRGFGTVERAE